MDTNISLESSELLLTKAENSSVETIVLFLPGIGGRAFSDRFRSLVDVSLEAGYAIARLNAWEGEESIQTKTYGDMQKVVTEAINHLLGLGYKHIIGVGKSFGGGLILSLHNETITKKILWAPAIGFGVESTIEKFKEVKLAKIENLKHIKLSPEYLAADLSQVCIVHGTADNAFSIETSRDFVAHAVRGYMIEVEGADHSFKTPESEVVLMKATKDFLVS